MRNFERASELDPRNVKILYRVAGTHFFLREYEQVTEAWNRILALQPKNVDAQVSRAWIDVAERADTRPLHAVVDKILRENPAAAGTLKGTPFTLALWEHDFVAADRALAAVTANTFEVRHWTIRFSRAYAEGLIARAKGDAAAAQAAFTAARKEQEELVRARPDDAGALCLLGLIDAGLGRKDEALREGRQAVELLPVTKNALDGPDLLYFYAVICAETIFHCSPPLCPRRTLRRPAWCSSPETR